MDGPISLSQSLVMYKKKKQKRSIVFSGKRNLTDFLELSKRKRKVLFFFLWPLLDRYSKYATGIYTSDKTSSSSCLALYIFPCNLRFVLWYTYTRRTGSLSFSSSHYKQTGDYFFSFSLCFVCFFLFPQSDIIPSTFQINCQVTRKPNFLSDYILKQLREIQGLLCLRTFHNKQKSISIKLEGAQHGSPFFFFFFLKKIFFLIVNRRRLQKQTKKKKKTEGR